MAVTDKPPVELLSESSDDEEYYEQEGIDVDLENEMDEIDVGVTDGGVSDLKSTTSNGKKKKKGLQKMFGGVGKAVGGVKSKSKKSRNGIDNSSISQSISNAGSPYTGSPDMVRNIEYLETLSKNDLVHRLVDLETRMRLLSAEKADTENLLTVNSFSIITLKEECEQLENLINQALPLSARSGSRSTRVDKLKGLVEDLSNYKEVHRRDNERYEAEVEKLKELVARLDKENTDLQGIIDLSKSSEPQEADAQTLKLQQENESLQASLRAAMETEQTLKKNLEEVSAEMKKLTTAREQYQAELARLQSEVNFMKEEMKKRDETEDTTAAELSRTVDQLTADVARFQELQQKAEAKAHELELELHTTIDESELKLEDALRQFDDLQGDYEALHTECEATTTALEHREADISNMAANLKALHDRVLELEAKAERDGSKYQTTREEYEQLQEEYDAATTELELLRESETQLKASVIELTSALSSAESKITGSRLEVQKLTQLLAIAEQEAGLQSSPAARDAELKRLEVECGQIQEVLGTDQLSDVVDCILSLQESYKQTEGEVIRLRSEIESAHEQLAEAREQSLVLDGAHKRIGTLENENIALTQIADQLKHKLDSAEAALNESANLFNDERQKVVKLSSVERQLHEYLQHEKVMNEELSSLKEKVEEYASQRDELRLIVEADIENIDRLTYELESVVEQNGEHEQEIAALKARLEQDNTDRDASYEKLVQESQLVSAELRASQSREAEIRGQLQALEAAKDGWTHTEQVLNQTIANLRSSLETTQGDLQNGLSTWTTERRDLERKLISLEDELTLSKEANLRLSTMNAELSNMKPMENIQRDLVESRAEVIRLTGIVDTQKLEIKQKDKLRDELNALQEEFDRCEAELRRSLADQRHSTSVSERHTHDVNNLHALVREKESLIMELQSKLSSSESKTHVVDRTIENLKSELQLANSENERLRTRIAEMVNELNSNKNSVTDASILSAQLRTAEAQIEHLQKALSDTLASQARSHVITTGAAQAMAATREQTPEDDANHHSEHLSKFQEGTYTISSVAKPAVVYSNVIANDGRDHGLVATTEGTHEVVSVLKQRLVEALFSDIGHLPGGTINNGVFINGMRKSQVASSFDELDSRSNVTKILSRSRKLWQLGEDFRLALVQSDPNLASAYQTTNSTIDDWDNIVNTLRLSAKVIEERNRDLETTYEELKAYHLAERKKAKNLIVAMKAKLEELTGAPASSMR